MDTPDHGISGASLGAPLQRRIPSSVQLLLDVIGVALIALFLSGFVQRNVTHQGDLKTYQLAAQAALQGLDPYEPATLSTMAGRRVFPFIYPPVALLPFMAASELPPKAVALGWMWAKIGLLALLVLAWWKWFTRGASLLSVALIAAFGWNSASQWDLGAGNVAILECGILWAAFGCYMSGRRAWFALLIVAAACFKLTPAVFLLLLLLPTEGAARNPRLLAAATIALALLVVGPTLVGPAARFAPFWTQVPDATGFGDANPSALGFATLSAQWLGARGHRIGQLGAVLWAAYVVLLVACSAPLLKRTYRRQEALTWVMIAVFLYLLVQPRPMAYGFVLLAPAPLFFAPRPFHRPPGQLLLSLMFASQGLWRLTSVRTDSPLVTYGPFLLTLCVWLLLVNDEATRPASSSDAGSMSRPDVARSVATRDALLRIP